MLILVIDDDELSRELLTLLLEVAGYSVVAAASGGEGLAHLGKMVPGPDAVLTDLQMPGISGAELARALRSALPSGVPILAMSGSDSRPAGRRALSLAGFDGFLLKPFAVADLQEALAALDDKRSAAGEEPRRESSTEASPPESLGEQGEIALNEDVFLKMRELMPSAQLGQMYALCIGDARMRLPAMRSLAGAGDKAGYRREAHAIKGGAGMIGAAEIYKLAERAEREGLGEDAGPDSEPGTETSRVTALLDQVSHACERLERILVERLQT